MPFCRCKTFQMILRIIIACVWLSLCSTFSIDYSPKNTPGSSSLDRAVKKASDNFAAFGKQENATLLVDGNNVRGLFKFQWDLVELQNRISKFCNEYSIKRCVVVWDHGRCKFAATENHWEEDVDMVILFSGLAQRADDVMVKEGRHLLSTFCNGDWSSIAFVTNDGGLRQKLISQATRLSSQQDSRPLLMDSTRFVELLSQQQSSDHHSEQNSSILLDTKESLRKFSALQKIGYNTRREKTWERCILSEALLQCYCQQPYDGLKSNQFSSSYMGQLMERGYCNPTSVENQNDKPFAVQGPSRLDRRQRRLLARYNKARRECKI